jgi:hypothetical protein
VLGTIKDKPSVAKSSDVEVFEERLKLNVAIHDFEWSSASEVA